MVNRIIGEHLQSNKRLIIPEFGAFIKKDNEGNVVFVPFLKKDDGVLTEKLSARYGLTAAEAKAVIGDYIFNIRKTVDANGFFAIDNIGRLKMDGNDIYYLDYNASERGDGKVKPEATATAGESGDSAPQQASEPARTHQHSIQPPHQQQQRSQPAQQQIQQPQAQRPQAAQQYAHPQARQRVGQDAKPDSFVSRAPLVNPTVQESSAVQQSKPADEQRVESAYRQPQPNLQRPAQAQQHRPIVQDQQMRQPGQQQPQRRPGQPRPGQRKPRKASSKMDKIIIVAILAATIAIASIIFSVVTNLGETRKVEVELAPATAPEVPTAAQPAN